MKYVVFIEKGNEVPLIFPEMVQHSRFEHLKPVSAGFCSFSTTKMRMTPNGSFVPAVSVWGNSVSLGLNSRRQDQDIIEYSQGGM